MGSLLILHCSCEKRGGGGGAVNLDLGIVLSSRRYTQTCLRSSELRRPQMVFWRVQNWMIFFLSLFFAPVQKKSRSDCVDDYSCRRAHAALRHRPASIPGVSQSVPRASFAPEFLLPQDVCGNVSPFLSTFSTFQKRGKEKRNWLMSASVSLACTKNSSI